jgi:hypothetical protein
LLVIGVLTQFLIRLASLIRTRRPAHLALTAVEQPALLVTLVHGTFARRAAWTMPDSSLSRALSLGPGKGILVRRFEWSGWNSIGARRAAARDLHLDLTEVARRFPRARHIVIGHSHGGNVALDAMRLSQALLTDGLICLATPVLTPLRRSFGAGEEMTVLTSFFVALAAPAILILKLCGASEAWQEGAVAAALILAPIWFARARSLSDAVAGSMPDGALDPERLVFVRSPSDEASGFIATLSLMNWTVGRIAFWPYRTVDWLIRLVDRNRSNVLAGLTLLLGLGVLLALTAINAASADAAAVRPQAQALYAAALLALVVGMAGMLLVLTAQVLKLARARMWVLAVAWPITIPAGLIAGFLLLPAVLLASLSGMVAIGWELLICSVFVEVAAEPCPTGEWQVIQLPPVSGAGLRHSSVYESDAGIAAILAAVERLGESTLVSSMQRSDEASSALPWGSAAPLRHT